MYRTLAVSVLTAFATAGAPAAAAPRLDARIAQIMNQPAVRSAHFGILVYDLDAKRTLYEHDADKFFTPASTTKLLTEGTTLALLGPEYRFTTNVYRTGPIDAHATVNGDLVLVGSGDPNLSGRIRSDGTLAFENEDHSYDGSPDTRAVAGDPLLVMRELAKQVAADGIKRIAGRVRADVSLFPEGEREPGTGAVISPLVVNDNIVDVTLTPALRGASVSMHVSPQTAYVSFVNHVVTAAAGSERDVSMDDRLEANGRHTVTVSGTMPEGSPAVLYAYDVPEPGRFAAVTLTQALREQGIVVDADPGAADATGSGTYEKANLVASHVSPPLREDVKVTLKVSDNLHAQTMPYLWSALGGAKTGQVRAGFARERAFLRRGGLDVGAAAQSDGLGGADWFTPRFIVSYLRYMRAQPYFADFYRGLPILGRDGTLFKIQNTSPAAGRVHAKTGTWGAGDLLNGRSMITAKGLAGYMTTKAGRHLAFCFYLNGMPVPHGVDAGHAAGEVLGSIATATYLYGQ